MLRNNTTTTTEDGIVRALQTRESPKDNERPLRTGINRKKINTKNKFQTIFRFAKLNNTLLYATLNKNVHTTHTSHTPNTRAFAARRRVKRKFKQRPLITRGGTDASHDRHVVILVCAGPTSMLPHRLHQLHSPV